MSGSGGFNLGSMFPTTQSSWGSPSMGPQWSPTPSYMGDVNQRMDQYRTMQDDFSQRMQAANAAAPFNEQYYLNSNPDVAAAVQNGDFTSGLDHYNQYGQSEGRQAGFVNMSDVLSPEEMWQRWTGNQQMKLDRAYSQATTPFGDPTRPGIQRDMAHDMNKYNNLWGRTQKEQYQNRIQRKYNNIFNTWENQPQ